MQKVLVDELDMPFAVHPSGQSATGGDKGTHQIHAHHARSREKVKEKGGPTSAATEFKDRVVGLQRHPLEDLAYGLERGFSEFEFAELHLGVAGGQPDVQADRAK